MQKAQHENSKQCGFTLLPTSPLVIMGINLWCTNSEVIFFLEEEFISDSEPHSSRLQKMSSPSFSVFLGCEMFKILFCAKTWDQPPVSMAWPGDATVSLSLTSLPPCPKQGLGQGQAQSRWFHKPDALGRGAERQGTPLQRSCCFHTPCQEAEPGRAPAAS